LVRPRAYQPPAREARHALLRPLTTIEIAHFPAAAACPVPHAYLHSSTVQMPVNRARRGTRTTITGAGAVGAEQWLDVLRFEVAHRLGTLGRSERDVFVPTKDRDWTELGRAIHRGGSKGRERVGCLSIAVLDGRGQTVHIVAYFAHRDGPSTCGRVRECGVSGCKRSSRCHRPSVGWKGRGYRRKPLTLKVGSAVRLATGPARFGQCGSRGCVWIGS